MLSISRQQKVLARRSLTSLLRVGAVLLAAGLLLIRLFSRGRLNSDSRQIISITTSHSDASELPCRSLPGANDTVVVIKTGVTEFAHKLPIHLETTVRCHPHYLIFSDHHEIFQGEDIIDALQPISSKYKEQNADFEFYRRVRERGRAALKPDELSDKLGFNRHPSDADKLAMGGWRLDKWKFLPMWSRVYELYPDMKWFVFIEADTYLFWSNLLKYQSVLDHTQDLYIGAELFMDWTKFAHGGGGVLMSNSAMAKFVDHYQEHLDDWESLVDRHWAGDIVLGRAMNAAGVTLTGAWPHMHPHSPGNDTWYWEGDDRRFWCHAAISYHHCTPEVVRDLWHVEQKWIEENTKRHHATDDKVSDLSGSAMKRVEVFRRYTQPTKEGSIQEWDNNSVDDQGEYGNYHECREVCEDIDLCMQWRYDHTTRRCWTNNEPRLGDASPNTPGFHSGWMPGRIRAFVDEQIPCGQEGFILP